MIDSRTNPASRRDEWSLENTHSWNNSFESKEIFVNKFKKKKKSLQILASLALLGPSTTRDITKFILEQSKKYPYHHKPRDRDSRKLEGRFSDLIVGRYRPRTGRKKSSERYPGLESKLFVYKVGKNYRDSDLYTLKFSGFLFALGFNFTDDEFKKFLNNVARYHIFFAYVKKISETTSIPFIKKIFLDPIREIIINEKILLGGDISFYFSSIAESIGRSLGRVRGLEFGFIDEEDVEKIQRVREIRKWTFYDDRATSDWYNAMIDIFYTNENEHEFFVEHANNGMEKNMLYKIMQKIHLVYFGYGGNFIPRKTQNIPHSNKWKESAKYYPEYKSPRDYDKKRKIMIRYDADHIPG